MIPYHDKRDLGLMGMCQGTQKSYLSALAARPNSCSTTAPQRPMTFDTSYLAPGCLSAADRTNQPVVSDIKTLSLAGLEYG